ncbi:MAG: hypothetical protein HQL72_05210 [Magnetococcales bacterium]|nr:hypothetical protein [Magnetococcales bacterium]
MKKNLASDTLGDWHDSPGRNEMEAVSTAIVNSVTDESANYQLGVIGVFGPWGVGKTHMLNLIGRKLHTSNRLTCCFPAWEYEAQGALSVSLLHVLNQKENYTQFEDDDFPSILDWSDDSFSEEVKQAGWLLLRGITDYAISQLPIGTSSQKALQRSLDRMIEADSSNGQNLNDQIPEIDQFRQSFQKYVDKIIEGIPDRKPKHLYILVDDLDRCSPNNLVRLLEWFKNYFVVDNCTFIIGLDHTMAARAILGHYKEFLGGGDSSLIKSDYGFQYLYKLFDRSYEIQPSKYSHQVAWHYVMKNLLPTETPERTNDDVLQWTRRKLGERSFAGEESMKLLLFNPALWVPRMMIRILDTYQVALSCLLKEASGNSVSQLSPNYPFWLLFISTIHHMFSPDLAETFIKKMGVSETSSEVRDAVDSLLSDFKTDIRQSLHTLFPKKGRQKGILKEELPDGPEFEYLYQLIREKTPRPFLRENNGS